MIIDSLAQSFEKYGSGGYGVRVTMAEHMLQAAAQAAAMGAAPSLIAAALLHDVGMFIEGGEADGVQRDHAVLGAAYLSKYFPASVCDPIGMHVAAKRYLCGVDPGYYSKLSAASVRTLGLQGGPMSKHECAAFERGPHAQAAVQLRQWDDAAKIEDLDVPSFESYRGLLESLLVGGANGPASGDVSVG